VQRSAPLQGHGAEPRLGPTRESCGDGCDGSDHVYDCDVATTGEERRETDSGIEIKPVYTAAEAPEPLELPGEFPFTRGPYKDMYRGRPWTIRQYAGFASAEETNQRFRYLLDRGQTGLSVAFDLPTQLGYDSDDARAAGEVGRTGVSIDSIADMELLFDGIPLGEVSTSMTINAPAALLLLLYELVAEEQGVDGDALRGTVQNDVLKEYIARGNYIFPPRPSMRITTDLFAYCAERIPRWNTISISGYHIREAGSTAVQELAFTLANGIAYCRSAVDAGLSPDEFGARLSFFFNAHNHFFQEIAKFRAARRLWARIMRERFGATNPKALALRFHAQTGGSTLTAQQPDNNVVRVAVQALSAVCGGAQSIHTNGYDEALALPSEHAAHIALRTQQLLAHEAGGTDTADPFGGSYFVEALTEELEAKAWELIERVDELGGAVAAIEQGFVQDEIEQAAFRWQQEVEAGERVIVGVNRFTEGEDESIELHRIDPAAEKRQLERTAHVRAERNPDEAAAAIAAVVDVARGDGNLLVPMRDALRARCTIGEICNALRDEFGMYDAQR
jgi:methylmalonyl-CoA mutase, N-terminal domain